MVKMDRCRAPLCPATILRPTFGAARVVVICANGHHTVYQR